MDNIRVRQHPTKRATSLVRRYVQVSESPCSYLQTNGSLRVIHHYIHSRRLYDHHTVLKTHSRITEKAMVPFMVSAQLWIWLIWPLRQTKESNCVIERFCEWKGVQNNENWRKIKKSFGSILPVYFPEYVRKYENARKICAFAVGKTHSYSKLLDRFIKLVCSLFYYPIKTFFERSVFAPRDLCNIGKERAKMRHGEHARVPRIFIS